MSNNTITLELTKKQIDELYETWASFGSESKPNYSYYQLKLENCVITAYTSNKVVFQGKDANIYSAKYVSNTVYPQAGSDEVGTGDYFGPVCVCATIIDKKTLQKIEKYPIQDSKSLTDAKILEIGKDLIKVVPHSLLIVSNKKYNEVHHGKNMNEIKAMLHNQAYLNLQKKYKLPSLCIIDQFTPEHSYYKYLKDEKEIVRNIHFETKAENKYISVACGSIIARYAFLKEFEKMEDKYDFKFEKGAGSLVDQCAKEFVDKFGFDELNNVAKLHFKNTDKITK